MTNPPRVTTLNPKAITDDQITAAAAVKDMRGKPIGRNVAIDVYEALIAAAPVAAHPPVDAQAIEAAARKLFTVKGRHHSQIAMRELGELLGFPVAWPEKEGKS